MLSGRSLASSTSSTMAPSLRPSSPPPLASSSRRHKPAPTFHLDNLPRFHPAVYQPPSTSQTHSSTATTPTQTSTATSSSSSSAFRFPPDSLRQYRDFVSRSTTAPSASATSSITSAPNTSYAKPAKPRLDPLGSPGPVTPLALEDEAGGYLATGLVHHGQGHGQPQTHAQPQSQAQTQTHADRMRTLPGGGATGDLVMHLIQSENERFAGKGGIRERR